MYASRGLRWNMDNRDAFYSEREYQAACHVAYEYELARIADNKRHSKTANREPEDLHSGGPDTKEPEDLHSGGPDPSNKPQPKSHTNGMRRPEHDDRCAEEEGAVRNGMKYVPDRRTRQVQLPSGEIITVEAEQVHHMCLMDITLGGHEEIYHQEESKAQYAEIKMPHIKEIRTAEKAKQTRQKLTNLIRNEHPEIGLATNDPQHRPKYNTHDSANLS